MFTNPSDVIICNNFSAHSVSRSDTWFTPVTCYRDMTPWEGKPFQALNSTIAELKSSSKRILLLFTKLFKNFPQITKVIELV